MTFLLVIGRTEITTCMAKVDMVVITSLTILDPLTAVQLSDNYENVLRIEDNGNSATK